MNQSLQFTKDPKVQIRTRKDQKQIQITLNQQVPKYKVQPNEGCETEIKRRWYNWSE